MLRRLQLKRNVDIHGISGTGIVAEGVQFQDGSLVMQWLTETSTTVHYKSLEDFRSIHVDGHGDAENNEIVFIDEEMEKSETQPRVTADSLKAEITKQRVVDYSTIWGVMPPTIKTDNDWFFDIPPKT